MKIIKIYSILTFKGRFGLVKVEVNCMPGFMQKYDSFSSMIFIIPFFQKSLNFLVEFDKSNVKLAKKPKK